MDVVFSLLDSTIRVATPLLLAALAGLFSERSGVIDIGLEGKMLAAAFAAAAVAAITGSAPLGLLVALGVGFLLSMMHGVASVTYNGNQTVSGMAINIAASGLTAILANAWFQQGGRTPFLEGDARFTPITLPLAETVKDVPLIGEFYYEIVSGHNILVYVTAILLPVVVWVVYGTRFGLRLRAVGENPHAVDTAGISVAKLRYQALAINGLLCGLAGSYLSTAQNNSFLQDMTAGKGFLALAALVFGKWRPYPTLVACLLFAFTDAAQVRLQGVNIFGIGPIPVQFIQALPYILTVLLLAGFVGRAVAPKAIGIPYVKSR